ncbi:MAG: molybdopterin converting factor subunit 1 [Anaerolineae bacterium]|nr:molybdopterin converting factor subunit 1 [Anaerolineae bacterium]
MNLRVLFFATLRDRAGVSSTSLTLPDGATVESLLASLAEHFPSIRDNLPVSLVAVNQEYATPDLMLQDGDEVALFPPVSGGAAAPYPEYLAVTPETLDLNAILTRITMPETGGVSVFSGVVRGTTRAGSDSRSTDHLEYESYQPMAESKLRQVAAEIRERFPKVQGIAVVQRIGRLAVGETTVLVACASGHRHDGIFDAARYGIDRLKEIVPVWKKEVGADGSFWVEGQYFPAQAERPGKRAAPPDEEELRYKCGVCQHVYHFLDPVVRCDCGGVLHVVNPSRFDYSRVDRGDHSLWRYRDILLPGALPPVTLSEGWTPLLHQPGQGPTLYFKLESLNPTGSFKDRGASVLVSALKAQGRRELHDDSSGNAGAALAAYAARAGLLARLFVPANASPAKVAQIAIYGGEPVPIEGPRSAATAAAESAALTGKSFYASHAYHPLFVHANRSLAYELWEQLGFRAPDAVVTPLGHGSSLLGLALGFTDLLDGGYIRELPRLYGVQAAACAPLWMHVHGHEGVSEGATAAEGIRIVHPARPGEVITAIRQSRGDILAVDEPAIAAGLTALARYGILAEPTSSVVWPAFLAIRNQFTADQTVVLMITGSGLKTSDLANFVTQQDN